MLVLKSCFAFTHAVLLKALSKFLTNFFDFARMKCAQEAFCTSTWPVSGASTFRITTLSIMSFSTMTFNIITFSITINKHGTHNKNHHSCWLLLCWVSFMLRVNYAECHYAACRYAECGGALCSAFLHPPSILNNNIQKILWQSSKYSRILCVQCQVIVNRWSHYLIN